MTCRRVMNGHLLSRAALPESSRISALSYSRTAARYTAAAGGGPPAQVASEEVAHNAHGELQPGIPAHRLAVEVVFVLARGEPGHCFGALGHRILGELARQTEPHGSLDITGGDRTALAVLVVLVLVVLAQHGTHLAGHQEEDLMQHVIQDRHRLGVDSRVGVHLF